MKNIQLLLCLCCMALVTKLKAVELTEGIKAKTFTVVFSGTGNHYGKCLKMEIVNNTNKPQTITCKPGIMLKSVDADFQDLIITQILNENILPKGKRIFLLNASCTERLDKCPDTSTHYIVKNVNDLRLKSLAEMIMKLDEQNYMGQQAIWSYMNNSDVNEIVGEDSNHVMMMRIYLGKMLFKDVLKYKPNKYFIKTPIVSSEVDLHAKGTEYLANINIGDAIEIGIYDQSNKLTSSITKMQAKENRFKAEWDITANDLNEYGKYYLRIKVNGVVRKEWQYTYTNT
jgi:hypothetical protein